MNREQQTSIRVSFGLAGAEQTRPVRHAVFVLEQGVPAALEWDDVDQHCVHAIATDHRGAVIGTGRLMPDGRIGRMAVLAPWRRRGVGARLLSALLQECRRRKWPVAHLHAQLSAADFYARHGFRYVGAPFTEAGIAHVLMCYQPGQAEEN